MRRIYVVFSTEIWKRRNFFRWNLNKCEIFSGKFWKRKNIFRQNMKEEKYFQVTCERWEIFSSKMWKRRNTMAAVGLEEKDGEQAERANDIGLNRRRLHLLLNIGFHKNISSWTLVNIGNIGEHHKNIAKHWSHKFPSQNNFFARVGILEADVTDEI